jgi:membrane protein YqaA with SNARE-associated domain
LSLASSVSKLAAGAAKILLPLGGWGLFLAAVLDSSFIPLPEGVDVWLISLSVLQPARMPYYVLLATAGSLLGCSMLYFLARWSEETFLEKKRYAGLPRVQRWVEKYEFGALLIGSILPPPMPFKLVVIAAGLIRGHFGNFLLALTIGRAVRYAGEGILAVRYGKQAWTKLVHLGPYAFGLVLVILLAFFVGHRFWKRFANDVDA